MNAESSSLQRQRPLLITAGVLIAVFAAVFLWRVMRLSSAYGSSYPAPPTEVSALTVKTETLPQSLDAVGSLEAVNQVSMSAEVAGRVTAIHFEAGSRATKGMPLVQLYDAPEQADRAAAVAAAQFAKLQYDRSQELAPTGAESREVLQQRTTELARAQAAVEQLDARITQKSIRAPFNGRVGIRRVNLGQYVNAGDPIATLVSLDPLFVNFTVPQQDLVKLVVGGKVAVRTDAFPDKTFTARINAIAPEVAADTRNVAVQATLPNPDELLRPGLHVSASLELPALQEAIVVPITAINTSASGDSVFVVKDGKAQPVPVVTGRRVDTRVVVEKGLAPGDVVITSGQLRVQPGSPVAVAAGEAAGAPVATSAATSAAAAEVAANAPATPASAK